jgi:hypothetical protein
VCTRYEDTLFQLVNEVDSKDGSQDHMQKFLESQPDLSHPTMTMENETEFTNISRSQNPRTTKLRIQIARNYLQTHSIPMLLIMYLTMPMNQP